VGIALAALLVVMVAVYLVAHFVYPRWLQQRVPEDAPRIAFSLDNSLVGQIGVTDVTYQRAMAKAGGRLITFRPDAAGDPNVSAEVVKELLESEQIDGVLLTGGGDVDPNLYGGSSNNTMLVHRLRDDFEIALIQAARDANLPILGICRGCQIINVALGGTVRNLREEEDLKGCHLVLAGHPVELVPGSTLAQILGVTDLPKVVSLHGQAVGQLAPEARIAATGPGDVVEAIEVNTSAGPGWIIGLQWHPEMTLDDQIQHKIFRNLVDRARSVQQRRRSH
jgi:putative glutamine amidotransferase